MPGFDEGKTVRACLSLEALGKQVGVFRTPLIRRASVDIEVKVAYLVQVGQGLLAVQGPERYLRRHDSSLVRLGAARRMYSLTCSWKSVVSARRV
jgi:hypothetical protein